MMNRYQGWFYVLWVASKRFYDEKYTYRASALAFTTLLSLVPLIAVILSLISLFPIFNHFMLLAQNYILENFIPTSSSLIQFYLNGFIVQATKLPLIGILSLIVTGAMLILTVETTLNDMWEVPSRKQKIIPMLKYWIMLILTPIIIGFSVFLSTYIFSLSLFSNTFFQLGIKIPILALLPLLINTILFTTLYTIVPNCKMKWREGFFGGFVAAVLFELAKKCFAFYIIKFPSYELIYGTLGTIPVFLVWIYISWLIVLFGALITHTQYFKLNKHRKCHE